MKQPWKTALAGVMVTTVLATSGAFAQVANTSQKGSLLMYARIDVRENFDTIVRMSNDNNSSVWVKCYYMNEKKGRRDFEFKLTKKQPAWWSVYNGSGSISVNEFPTDGEYPGSAYLGELICWAVNASGSEQISFNHLSGTATVYDFVDTGGPSAFQYNSWNFKAQVPTVGAAVGTAGNIQLTGLPGAYDACPGYLIGHFSPAGASLDSRNRSISIGDTDLSVIACNQDLRQDFTPHFTKLELTVWNEDETKFTGAYECSDGYHYFTFATTDVAPEIFTYDVLESNAALLKVQGVASTKCRASEAAGLVGVLSTSTYSFADGSLKENEIGTTLNVAGTRAGYVLWNPQDAIVPTLR